MKTIMRSAALRVPPIRRLHDFAMQQARENQERATALEALAAELARESQERAAALEALAAQQADSAGQLRERQLLGELAAAADERDALELQLYVLRSDQQRATARNQELGAALHAAEERAQQERHAAEVRAEQALTAALQAAEARAEQTLAAALQAAEARAEQALAAARAAAAVTAQDLSLLYARLAGRMTLLSSDIARLRPTPAGGDGATLYLDLLERTLTGMLGEDVSMDPWSKGYDAERRLIGRDWPRAAQTMIGLARLRNLRVLAERVVQEGIPGDLLEAGVWRGGACILMRGVLAANGISDRTVWVANSFAGLPAADPAAYPADAGDQHATYDVLRVSSEEVEANFRRYGLLDRQVRFLKGWFADTLPAAPIDRLAILRLDGDMYASTIQTLDALYAKVSPGGYVIIDDYILAGCRQAVDDFRARHGIADDLNDVDGAAVFWRKS